MDRFHELRVLVAVAETGGFAKAAARLSSSPAAITRAIAGLEARLGVELFMRTTRRVHLTENGRTLAERARQILSDLDAAEKETTGELGMPTGKLTITASLTMGRTILTPIVSAFLAVHPRVTAQVILADRVVNLVEEGIDVALRVGELPDSTLMSRGVGEVRRLLVASPEYLRKRGNPRSPTDLKQHVIIAFTGLMPNREWIYVSEKGTNRMLLQPRLEINDAAAALAAAEAGEGITVALSYMVAKKVREKRLATVLLEFAPPAHPVQIIYPVSRLISPKVRAFVDFATPRLRAAVSQSSRIMSKQLRAV